MRRYAVKRIRIQPDRLNHLKGNYYDVISFKRAVVDCHVTIDPKPSSPDEEGGFTITLDWRGPSIQIAARKMKWGAGAILRDLKYALKATTGEDLIHLPPAFDSYEDKIAAGVTDATRISGLLHLFMEAEGWTQPAQVTPRALPRRRLSPFNPILDRLDRDP